MDKPEIYKVSTVKAYRRKLAAAQRVELLRHSVPIAIVSPRPVSGLPTEPVDFPALRVVVDMWRIVKSAAPRPASMREAFGG